MLNGQEAATYFGYFLLGAGIVLFVIALFDDRRKSMPLMFTAVMLAAGGLAILQLVRTGAPMP